MTGKKLSVQGQLRKDVKSMEGQFKIALPEHVTPERFCRTIMTACNTEPKLLACSRHSLMNECLKAASDGLVPDGREGALVPYGNEAVWVPMVQGLLKKIRNSGELKHITVNLVYQNDAFDFWTDENGDHLKHRPMLTDNDEERGSVTHGYCVANTHEGGNYVEVMSKSQIDKVRAVSKVKSKDGPWFQWYEEMAKKTVLRRAYKSLPSSTDLDTTIRRNDENLINLTAVNAPTDKPEQAGQSQDTKAMLDNFAESETGQKGAAEGEEDADRREAARKKKQQDDARSNADDVDPETGEVEEKKTKAASKPKADTKSKPSGEKLTPYEQGQQAHGKKKSRRAVPYEADTDDAENWLAGWDDAKIEADSAAEEGGEE